MELLIVDQVRSRTLVPVFKNQLDIVLEDGVVLVAVKRERDRGVANKDVDAGMEKKLLTIGKA